MSTQSDSPHSLADWLLQVESASSLEQAVACLNQANALAPSDPAVQQKTYRTIHALLEQNPHLVYLDETGVGYRVRSGEHMLLYVPKCRSVPEPFPVERPVPLHNAYRWLWMAFIGLVLAGLGAMVFATLAAISAIRVNFQPISRADRIRSLVVLLLSGGLWLCGLLIGVILLVHLI